MERKEKNKKQHEMEIKRNNLLINRMKKKKRINMKKKKWKMS